MKIKRTEHHNDLSFELILDYVEGLLSESNAEIIKARINESEEYWYILEGVKYYYEHISNDRDELEKYMAQLWGNLEKTPEAPTPKLKSLKIGKYWMIAATVSIFIVSMVLIIHQKMKPLTNHKIVENYLEIYEAPVIERGMDGNNITELWNKAIIAYKNSEFLVAQKIFEKIEQSDERNYTSKFYLALCYLYQNKPLMAIPLFEKLQTSPTRYRQQALWYLSLSHIKNRNYEQAKRLLQIIITNRNHYQHDKANNLINEL